MAAWDLSLPKHKGLSQVEKVTLSYWFKTRPFKGLSQVEKNYVFLLAHKFVWADHLDKKLDTFFQKKMASTCWILILYNYGQGWLGQ